MGFWDDVGNGINNFFGTIAKNSSSTSGINDPYAGMGGTADTSGGASGPIGYTPKADSPSPAGMGSPSGGMPSAAGLASLDPSGPGGGGSQPVGTGQSMLDTFKQLVGTPALDPRLVQSAMQGIQGIQTPDYLGMAKQNYQNVLNQISGVQNQVHGAYDDAKANIGNIYDANVNAATLGNNNILQSIAQNEGQALQGNANTAAQSLAGLKNAQLAERAMLAQRAGASPQEAAQAAATYGTNTKIDPNEVAAQGLVANAQQAANNAQSAAADRTGLNNDMAMAMRNQGGILQNQLQNQRIGYDSSMGKYLADLANEESAREMQASQQNYQTQLNKIMAGYNMAKDSSAAQTEWVKAVAGSRGFMQALPDLGTYDQNQATAALRASQAGSAGMNPFMSAASQNNPGLSKAYATAIDQFNQPGVKPTQSDLVRGMISADSSINPADALNFVSQAGMSKPTGAFNVDDLMSYMQGQ